MDPDALKQAAIEIFGERGWVSALAECLGVDRTQIWRYMNGKSYPPGPVQAAMIAWLKIYRLTGEKPQPLRSDED